VLYRDSNASEPRLGLAIGKKNCRLATNRNRLKRVIRESFRRQYESLPNIDIVVLNQPAAARADNKALFLSLEHHWQRCREAAQERAGKR